MANLPAEAPPEALRRYCDPNERGFETTNDVATVTGIVGQDRAIDAIAFGLEISTYGYNLYVSGVPGTGRTTTVISEIQELALTQPAPDDWCYVYNFSDPF